MPDFDPQHRRTAPLRALERRLLRAVAQERHPLHPREVDVLKLALNIARLELFRTDQGDVDLFEQVAPFRHWLLEQLGLFVDESGRRPIDWPGLRKLAPAVFARVSDVRRHILQHESNAFSEEQLEAEVRFRRLVLVLGGGGGSGYAHLGTFAVLSELGLTPSLIVGSSMGALMGLFRAVTVDYDPATVMLSLPRPQDFGSLFSPYRGFSRYGFPGGLEMTVRRFGEQVFRNALGITSPPIRELAIPYRAVSTGLRTGIGLALSEVESEIERAGRSFTPFAFRRRLQLFSSVVATMVARPRFLAPVVFGSDPGLENFLSVDAVGFSCAVPGLIHYDIYQSGDPSALALSQLFDERGFFRLTDGGIVSNVPARAAWTAVQRGEIRSRNAFVLSFDCFAPQFNLNSLFVPVQQIARTNVMEDRPYSDFHITYRNPPTPIQLLKSTESLQSVIASVRSELASERAYLATVLKPLPRWSTLVDDLSLHYA